MQRKELRSEILEVAKGILTEQGLDAVSIRKIATEIGCSPTYIYYYFKSKNEILYAIHQHAFSLFCTYIDQSGTIKEPLSKLKAIGKFYLLFAKENPEYYNIIFQDKHPMLYLQSEEKHWEEGKKIVDFLNLNVQECQKLGYFNEKDAEVISMIVWGLAHGLTSPCASEQLKTYGEASQDLESYRLKIYTEMLDKIA